MEPSLDRFSQGYTPKEPDEVGSCEACSGTVYDYELIECNTCDAQIHKGCSEECDGCGMMGCKSCLKENDEGLLLCENCRPEEEIESEQQVTLVDVVRAATEKLS
jgi:hypothetical protein